MAILGANLMNGSLTQTQFHRSNRLIRLTILLLSLVVMVLAVFLEPLLQSRPAPVSQDKVIAAIEDQYGIRITMLAMTAGGGVLDFRFQVVDPEKATNYMQGDYEDLPYLIVEDSGTRINPRPHTHHVGYDFGRTYYHFYRNPQGVVKTGSEVAIVLGDLRLNHIIVR
jgi:hypothetical protein